MRIAKGAKAERALGATLIACLLPVCTLASTNEASVQGINSGDLRGINSGDLRGINSGDLRGINSGDLRGINSGDLRGINSGDLRGINSGDLRGINSGDLRGINSGDLRGINSGDLRGINSGDLRGINSGLVLSGPVDSVDLSNGVFTSLGQTVMASHDMLQSMSPGDLVSVTGSVAGPGWLYADAVEVADSGYVPGATEIFVVGIPSGVDRSLGQIQLGGLSIDYTPALSSGSIPSGQMLGFRGIQPNSHGILISDAVFKE